MMWFQKKTVMGQFRSSHTIYPGNNMCQKYGRKSGLWILLEIVNKTYAENMKKIVGAVWELPAK